MFLVFLLFSLVFIILLWVTHSWLCYLLLAIAFPQNLNFSAPFASQEQNPKWLFIPFIACEHNQSRARTEVLWPGFPCAAAVVCWEELTLLHLGCAERSILSPSVSQLLEQPRASAWHRCWGNAGKHRVKKTM